MSSCFVPTRHCAAKSFKFSYSNFTILEVGISSFYKWEKYRLGGVIEFAPNHIILQLQNRDSKPELLDSTAYTVITRWPWFTSSAKVSLTTISHLTVLCGPTAPSTSCHTKILNEQYYLPLTLSISFLKTGTKWYLLFEFPESSGAYLEYDRYILVQKVMYQLIPQPIILSNKFSKLRGKCMLAECQWASSSLLTALYLLLNNKTYNNRS